MISAEEQKILDEAKSRAIRTIDEKFSIIQEYFETDVSLARFATNKNMTIWQFKWLLNKYRVPPKAKKYREMRELKQAVTSYEDLEDREYATLSANDKDDFSGEY